MNILRHLNHDFILPLFYNAIKSNKLFISNDRIANLKKITLNYANSQFDISCEVLNTPMCYIICINFSKNQWAVFHSDIYFISDRIAEITRTNLDTEIQG